MAVSAKPAWFQRCSFFQPGVPSLRSEKSFEVANSARRIKAATSRYNWRTRICHGVAPDHALLPFFVSVIEPRASAQVNALTNYGVKNTSNACPDTDVAAQIHRCQQTAAGKMLQRANDQSQTDEKQSRIGAGKSQSGAHIRKGACHTKQCRTGEREDRQWKMVPKKVLRKALHSVAMFVCENLGDVLRRGNRVGHTPLSIDAATGANIPGQAEEIQHNSRREILPHRFLRASG